MSRVISDLFPQPDAPATGIPVWLVADTLGITTRQVYRLERQGILDSWGEGFARLYGLDQVRRLARERRRQAATDSRVARPSDEAMRVLEQGMSPELFMALASRDPRAQFWGFVKAATQPGRNLTREQHRLFGDLAALAIRSGAGASPSGPRGAR